MDNVMLCHELIRGYEESKFLLDVCETGHKKKHMIQLDGVFSMLCYRNRGSMRSV